MSKIYQDITNSGNFINSNGDGNNVTLSVEDNSIYKLAVKEIIENVQGTDQEDAKDVIESIEDAMNKEKPRLAQRLHNSLPDVAKTLPAIVQIGQAIANLL
ncbi:hypothetical protein IHC39_002765 [Enterococcus faecalis]|uniref:hypothetical protein n=1 Tax=Enterococcus TaxID=1350 RepID=UPI00032DEE00|nr:hypothetical protein [Enterococcus faecalis]EGO2586791.1 hypothetical protein [Enterococcus faecalis]EGO2588160.1 hypothetical protein [Enterococcus faecalis]EGO5850897.1 hypothetical protein [Enterococcus faecalis]EJI7260519.1 hypothetical protein [Enterococcus faecalis]EOJ53958.1 hypothetical protein WMI_02128 [Enterococcus faecalis EnGen0363]